jgi:uncharacterized protein YmfQ (DUF2313 family)
VKLPTLRKFERTGQISLKYFLQLAEALGYLEAFAKALEPIAEPFKTINDVLKPEEKIRKRGRLK